jgi:hypothetical protein
MLRKIKVWPKLLSICLASHPQTRAVAWVHKSEHPGHKTCH